MPHWTEKSTKDYIYRISADFRSQLDKVNRGYDHAMPPFNLHTMVRMARMNGLKISVVLYCDGDSKNEHGPIHSDIFRMCWEKCGKPEDFFKMRIIPKLSSNTMQERRKRTRKQGPYKAGRAMKVTAAVGKIEKAMKEKP